MEDGMKQQAVKTFNLKMFNQTEEQLFTNFKKLAIYHGENPRDTIVALIKQYNKDRKVTGKKLVTETELLEAIKDAGLKTTKAILIKHRQLGNIEGMWWSNDDGRVVYDKDRVLKFFRGRQGRGSGGWLNRRNGNGRAQA